MTITRNGILVYWEFRSQVLSHHHERCVISRSIRMTYVYMILLCILLVILDVEHEHVLVCTKYIGTFLHVYLSVLNVRIVI